MAEVIPPLTPPEREARIRETMDVSGVDRVTAEFMIAQELGEIEGDLIAETHAPLHQ